MKTTIKLTGAPNSLKGPEGEFRIDSAIELISDVNGVSLFFMGERDCVNFAIRLTPEDAMKTANELMTKALQAAKAGA